MLQVEVMTVAEYQQAINARRALHSELLQAEIAETRAAIERLKTARGKVELRRKATGRAAQYMRTAQLAGNIAGLAMLNKASTEDAALGRQRLLEATAEMYGETVEDVIRREKGERGRPKTNEHGLQMYKSKRCKCDVCRAANADRQRRYQENRALRELTMPKRVPSGTKRGNNDNQ